LHLCRFEDQPVVPWRNGGGLTREIAVHAAPETPSQILWRVSAATIAAAGPFSRFDGIDRTLAVLDGNGLVLRSGPDRVTLTTDSAPYAFDGERDIFADNIDGPTIDLNVMTLRGTFTHTVTPIHLDVERTHVATADTTMLVFNGTTQVASAGLDLSAEKGDALLDIARGDTVHLSAAAEVQAYLIEITAAG
jgi:uncharacterized protein